MTLPLSELADRVERLEAADREVDALIRCALWAPEDAIVEQSPINGAWCVYHGTDRAGNPRLFDLPKKFDCQTWRGEYTASLDAAMSLIADGDEWEISTLYNIARASVGLNRNDGGTHGEHKGANPVLALLAAALRACITETSHAE